MSYTIFILAEGLAKGEAKGKAETLLKQLRLKFGNLPTEAESEACRAGPASGNHWMMRWPTEKARLGRQRPQGHASKQRGAASPKPLTGSADVHAQDSISGCADGR